MESMFKTSLLSVAFLTAALTGSLGLASPPADAVWAPLGHDLTAIQETVRLPRATAYNDADGDKIFDSLERKYLETGLATLPVIVTFRYGSNVQAAFNQAVHVAGPFHATHIFWTLGGFAAPLTLDQVTRLARLDAVRQIEWSQPGTPELDTATLHMGARAVQEHLAINGDRDGQPQSFTNKDITIGILDTGFDGQHVDLRGKFLAFIDMQDRKLKDPYDSGNHGTHVASIAGGLGVGNPLYAGVAPGAAFVGVKITGGETKANAIAGMDFLIGNKTLFNIRISTISFGFGATADGTDALELAMDRAFEAGILPFKSNGNSGPEEGTTTIPGGARGIVSVGSMLDPGPPATFTASPVPSTVQQIVGAQDYGFRISTYSSRGPTSDGRIKPDVSAPGQNIMAASKGTIQGYVSLSGTSMASPFAAGTAALILSADPSLTPEGVRAILFATAEDWGPKGPDIDYGNGRLNVLLAVQTALVNRLAREGADFQKLEQVAAVAGPPIPFHAAGSLSGNYVERSFTIQDAKQPLAVTALLTGLRNPVSGTAQRVYTFEILGPGDVSVGRVSTTPMVRQQVVAFVPPAAGTYNVRAITPLVGVTIGYDVSAGLPPPAILPGVVLPNVTAYEEKVGKARAVEKKSQDPGATPGLGFAALALVLGAAMLMVHARRKGE